MKNGNWVTSSEAKFKSSSLHKFSTQSIKAGRPLINPRRAHNFSQLLCLRRRIILIISRGSRGNRTAITGYNVEISSSIIDWKWSKSHATASRQKTEPFCWINKNLRWFRGEGKISQVHHHMILLSLLFVSPSIHF